MIVLGVDIANMDGNRCDWAKAYAAGVRFAYLRAMFSASVDSTYANEAAAARAAGVKPGPYFFPDERVDALPIDVQIQAFVDHVAKHSLPGDLPAAFDVEYSKGTRATGRTRAELCKLILAIAAKLTAALGYAPVLYSSKRVVDGTDTDTLDATHQGVDLSPLKRCPFWCSRYITDYHQAPIGDDPDELRRLDALPLPPIPAYLGDERNVAIRQTQGDSIGLAGFTHTVDINELFVMEPGESGERVKWAQERLSIAETGTFDTKTADAVRRFQGELGLEVTGAIDLDTWARMAQRP